MRSDHTHILCAAHQAWPNPVATCTFILLARSHSDSCLLSSLPACPPDPCLPARPSARPLSAPCTQAAARRRSADDRRLATEQRRVLAAKRKELKRALRAQRHRELKQLRAGRAQQQGKWEGGEEEEEERRWQRGWELPRGQGQQRRDQDDGRLGGQVGGLHNAAQRQGHVSRGDADARRKRHQAMHDDDSGGHLRELGQGAPGRARGAPAEHNGVGRGSTAAAVRRVVVPGAHATTSVARVLGSAAGRERRLGARPRGMLAAGARSRPVAAAAGRPAAAALRGADLLDTGGKGQKKKKRYGLLAALLEQLARGEEGMPLTRRQQDAPAVAAPGPGAVLRAPGVQPGRRKALPSRAGAGGQRLPGRGGTAPVGGLRLLTAVFMGAAVSCEDGHKGGHEGQAVVATATTADVRAQVLRAHGGRQGGMAAAGAELAVEACGREAEEARQRQVGAARDGVAPSSRKGGKARSQKPRQQEEQTGDHGLASGAEGGVGQGLLAARQGAQEGECYPGAGIVETVAVESSAAPAAAAAAPHGRAAAVEAAMERTQEGRGSPQRLQQQQGHGELLPQPHVPAAGVQQRQGPVPVPVQDREPAPQGDIPAEGRRKQKRKERDRDRDRDTGERADQGKGQGEGGQGGRGERADAGQRRGKEHRKERTREKEKRRDKERSKERPRGDAGHRGLQGAGGEGGAADGREGRQQDGRQQDGRSKRSRGNEEEGGGEAGKRQRGAPSGPGQPHQGLRAGGEAQQRALGSGQGSAAVPSQQAPHPAQLRGEAAALSHPLQATGPGHRLSATLQDIEREFMYHLTQETGWVAQLVGGQGALTQLGQPQPHGAAHTASADGDGAVAAAGARVGAAAAPAAIRQGGGWKGRVVRTDTDSSRGSLEPSPGPRDRHTKLEPGDDAHAGPEPTAEVVPTGEVLAAAQEDEEAGDEGREAAGPQAAGAGGTAAEEVSTGLEPGGPGAEADTGTGGQEALEGAGKAAGEAAGSVLQGAPGAADEVVAPQSVTPSAVAHGLTPDAAAAAVADEGDDEVDGNAAGVKRSGAYGSPAALPGSAPLGPDLVTVPASPLDVPLGPSPGGVLLRPGQLDALLAAVAGLMAREPVRGEDGAGAGVGAGDLCFMGTPVGVQGGRSGRREDLRDGCLLRPRRHRTHPLPCNPPAAGLCAA